MIRSTPRIPTLLCVALLTGGVTAQIGPEQAIRKIADEVQQEMATIDQLLRDSSRGGSPTQPATDGGQDVRELIDQTKESHTKVLRGIDRLIEELQNMAQQSQSSSSSSQDQQQQQQGGPPQDGEPQPQQGQGSRPQGARQEIQTPEMVDRGESEGQQRQPGENQPAQPQGEQPRDGDHARAEGENRIGTAPAEGATEAVERGADAEKWGDLQKYVPPQYQRAGVPQVPAKYRRLHEAFQKRSSRSGDGR